VTGTQSFFELERVYKRFGRALALRDVSLVLGAGECVALLGANGAGKTTLLRILATVARPTRGVVRAFGADAFDARTEVRARIGVVGHHPYVYPELTCTENLAFFATMYSVADCAARVTRVLADVGLADRAGDRAATLSRGLLQRLNLARAVLHEPAVLILDEPDTGLDADGRAVLERVVRCQAERGGGVIFTTHGLALALELATRVVVLRGGWVVLDDDREHVDASHLASAIGQGVAAAMGD
jgi:heme exporter protein A